MRGRVTSRAAACVVTARHLCPPKLLPYSATGDDHHNHKRTEQSERPSIIKQYSQPSLSQPAIMWYDGESWAGLPPMLDPPGPNMRFVVDWLERLRGEPGDDQRQKRKAA